MTIEQLKAKAYDLLAMIQELQRQLQMVNNEIVKKQSEAKIPDVVPESVDPDVTK